MGMAHLKKRSFTLDILPIEVANKMSRVKFALITYVAVMLRYSSISYVLILLELDGLEWYNFFVSLFMVILTYTTN